MSEIRLLVLALLLSTAALGQEGDSQKADLGDTGAPPPSAEDLGVIKDEPGDAAPAPEKKKKKKPADKSGDKPADKSGDSGAADAGKAAAAPGVAGAEATVARPAEGAAERAAERAASKAAERTKPAPAPPPAPAVPAETLEKASKLKAELDAALIAEPGDHKALDALSQAWQPDSVLNAEPTLRPLLKLARARSLTLQERFDEANNVLNDARGLVDGVQGSEHKPLVGQFRYRVAELDEARSKLPGSCGANLGLRRLRGAEGTAARTRTQRLAAKYKNVVQSGERFWSRRAAFKIASLYAEFYTQSLEQAPSFRGVSLPSPFAVSRIDEAHLTAGVLGGSWPAEIARLYSEVLASIDAREPDPILLELVRKKAAEFARVTLPGGDKIENPWRKDEHAGLIRYNRRFERRVEDAGTWKPVDPAVARKELSGYAEKAPGGIEHAFALAGLAEAGPAPTPAAILTAVKHADPRVKLAGLVAAEKQPDAVLYDAVVDAFATSTDKGPLFGSLKASLFGVRERALLALRAIANKDRALAEKVLQEQKLPPRERVWVIAELGESRLQYTLQNLVWDKEPSVAATALYALYLAASKSSSGYMRPNEPGLIGCVSKGLQSLD